MVNYGTFDRSSATSPELLPENVTGVPAKIKMLHRLKPKTEVGLVEFCVEETGSTATAFFHVGDVVTEKRAFGDLATIVPANTTHKIKIHATLKDKNSVVPYIASGRLL